MNVKYITPLMVFLMGSLLNLSAQESQATIVPKQEKSNLTFYAGINPISLLAFLPNNIGSYATGFGIASNQEYGVSLYGGMHFAKAHSFEMRLSTGPDIGKVWDTQIQLGYIWYPFEQFMNKNGGLNTGLMFRQFFWNQRQTNYVTYNFTPELLLGWRFKVKSLAFDVRVGWNIFFYQWSTKPQTKDGAGSMPFPFNLTLTTGIAWQF